MARKERDHALQGLLGDTLSVRQVASTRNADLGTTATVLFATFERLACSLSNCLWWLRVGHDEPQSSVMVDVVLMRGMTPVVTLIDGESEPYSTSLPVPLESVPSPT